MIISWKHKGLKLFFETGSLEKIQSRHAVKIHDVLQLLDVITEPSQMSLPGLRLHKLKGALKDHFSVTVNKNWRITFGFDGRNVILVDYIDYH